MEENTEQEIKPNDEPRAFQYYEQPLTSRLHTFYLTGEILEPQHYIDMFHRIRTANPQDLIYIILNTGGGVLDTGVQLINCMQNSPAKCITVLEGECHSLGTIIFLSGDEFIVNDHGLMMFHNFSGGVFGKGNEQVAQLEATVKWFSKMIKKIYYPFLSEDEIDRLLKGEDLWMDSDEIRKRLKNMIKILNEPKKPAAKKKRAPRKKATQ